MFYYIALFFCRIVLLFRFKIKAVGRENIPREGGCILALNHRSNYDVVIAGITCPRRLSFMAKAELFKNWFFARLITACGAFPVQRGKGDIGAVKSTLTKLKNNEMVLMFPEGRRVLSLDEEKSVRAKPGAVMIAARAQVPIVPAYISGELNSRGTVTVSYGKPIYYTEYKNEKLSPERLQELSDILLDKVREMRV